VIHKNLNLMWKLLSVIRCNKLWQFFALEVKASCLPFESLTERVLMDVGSVMRTRKNSPLTGTQSQSEESARRYYFVTKVGLIVSPCPRVCVCVPRNNVWTNRIGRKDILMEVKRGS
jgi:hypothetical protein